MSSDKNELLFQEFEINYNNLPAVHRKGTILLRVKVSRKHDVHYENTPMQYTEIFFSCKS